MSSASCASPSSATEPGMGIGELRMADADTKDVAVVFGPCGDGDSGIDVKEARADAAVWRPTSLSSN